MVLKSMAICQHLHECIREKKIFIDTTEDEFTFLNNF